MEGGAVLIVKNVQHPHACSTEAALHAEPSRSGVTPRHTATPRCNANIRNGNPAQASNACPAATPSMRSGEWQVSHGEKGA